MRGGVVQESAGSGFLYMPHPAFDGACVASNTEGTPDNGIPAGTSQAGAEHSRTAGASMVVEIEEAISPPKPHPAAHGASITNDTEEEADNGILGARTNATNQAGTERSTPQGGSSTMLKPVIQKGWGFLFVTYAILGAVFAANGTMCLVARKVPAVGDFMAHPTVYSLEGAIGAISSVVGYCLLMHFRQHKRISICLMVVQAISTSSLVAMFNGTVFGNTLLVSAVELSVMMWSLSIYTYFASRMGHAFTYTEPFLLSTLPAVAAVVMLKMTVHIGLQTWLFALCAGIFLNMNILRKSNKLIGPHEGGEGVTEAIILYGYVVRRFLGHVSFLLFDTECK